MRFSVVLAVFAAGLGAAIAEPFVTADQCDSISKYSVEVSDLKAFSLIYSNRKYSGLSKIQNQSGGSHLSNLMHYSTHEVFPTRQSTLQDKLRKSLFGYAMSSLPSLDCAVS